MKYHGTDIEVMVGDVVRAKTLEGECAVTAMNDIIIWIANGGFAYSAHINHLTFIRRDLPPEPAASAETRTHDTGAIRSTDADDVAYHCMPLLGLRRVAQTACEGAKKYSPYNWAKGFKASVLMNHATDHLVKWGAGDRSEDHLAHAAWNLMALMHFEEQGRNDLMDCEPKGASNAE